MMNLNGKWAFVTGASRGVGTHLATALAELGCNIVLHSRSKEHTAGIAAKIREKGVSVIAVEAELNDQTQVDAMLNDILEQISQVNILFNNAAIMAPYRTNPWPGSVSPPNACAGSQLRLPGKARPSPVIHLPYDRTPIYPTSG